MFQYLIHKGLPPRWQSILNQSGITQEEIKASPQTVIDVLRFYTTMLGSPSAIEDIHMTLTPKPKPRKLMDRSASSSSLNAVIGTTANDIPRLTITTATTVKKGSLSQMDFNNSASSALNRALNAVPVPDKPATTSKGSGMKKCSSLPELEPASAALSRAIHSISPPNHLVVLPRSASKVVRFRKTLYTVFILRHRVRYLWLGSLHSGNRTVKLIYRNSNKNFVLFWLFTSAFHQ
jgi:hypothetical protein